MPPAGRLVLRVGGGGSRRGRSTVLGSVLATPLSLSLTNHIQHQSGSASDRTVGVLTCLFKGGDKAFIPDHGSKSTVVLEFPRTPSADAVEQHPSKALPMGLVEIRLFQARQKGLLQVPRAGKPWIDLQKANHELQKPLVIRVPGFPACTLNVMIHSWLVGTARIGRTLPLQERLRVAVPMQEGSMRSRLQLSERGTFLRDQPSESSWIHKLQYLDPPATPDCGSWRISSLEHVV